MLQSHLRVELPGKLPPHYQQLINLRYTHMTCTCSLTELCGRCMCKSMDIPRAGIVVIMTLF